MVLIIILIVIGLFLFFIIKSVLNKAFVIREFRDSNMIVFGKKGSGKDLLFQTIINARKEHHYSNIKFNSKTLPITINDLSLFPNTYENLINNNIEKVNPNLKEKYDIYISDGGIYLPSQYDSSLDKKYPSLPIFYATQRHLYNSNTHVNTQYLGRLYKKLREQADGYIKCHSAIFIGPIYIQFITFYERYESAERSLLPMSKALLNGMQNGLYEQYYATNGVIKPMFLIGTRKKIIYDTRHFRNVFFNSPNKSSETR